MNEEEVAEILTVPAKGGREREESFDLRLHVKKTTSWSLFSTCVSTAGRCSELLYFSRRVAEDNGRHVL